MRLRISGAVSPIVQCADGELRHEYGHEDHGETRVTDRDSKENRKGKGGGRGDQRGPWVDQLRNEPNLRPERPEG